MRKPRIYPAPRTHGSATASTGMILDPSHARCGLCGRPLDVSEDALSVDCGGDCWGCIGKIEADGGDGESRRKVDVEIEAGLRDASGDPKDWE